MEALMRSAPQTKPTIAFIRPIDRIHDLRNEAQMISAILKGQTHIYHDLVRPYEGVVYRIAFMMLRNEADAERVAQQVFVNAYRNLQSFRSQTKFSTWLLNAVSRESRECLRQRQIAV